MPEPINPVEVENGIRATAERIAEGVKVCDRLYRAFLTADRAYDRAYALAYRNFDGPAHEKRYAAEIATAAERAARDDADAAYKHADRLAKALEAELRAWQSVGASVRAMYAIAGTGER